MYRVEIFVKSGAVIHVEVETLPSAEDDIRALTEAEKEKQEIPEGIEDWLISSTGIFRWLNENSDSQIMFIRPDDVTAIVAQKIGSKEHSVR